MPKKKNLLGAWAFLIGVILAVIFAFITAGAWLGWVLVIIGIIIGLLNIADVEVQPFLLAGAILVIVSYFGSGVFALIKIGDIPFLANILSNILMLFVPATIIVALKSVFSMAKV
ncbi:MAG: hypothetical protein ACPLXC_02145 [Candidatus Pacearchaeota archaeon]